MIEDAQIKLRFEDGIGMSVCCKRLIYWLLLTTTTVGGGITADLILKTGSFPIFVRALGLIGMISAHFPLKRSGRVLRLLGEDRYRRSSGHLAGDLHQDRLQGIPELGGTLIATRTVEGGGQVGAAQLDNVLGAGRAATVSVEWAVPSEPVSHTLTVRVDPYDAIEEWDEDNDVQVVTVIPDLTVSEIYARYQPGQEDVLVKALISNTGALEALTTTVEFRQETVTGTLLSTVDLAPLAAGQSAVVTATWPISGVSGGWHYIYAIVDPRVKVGAGAGAAA